MRCPACGAPIDADESGSCPRCGATFHADDVLATERLPAGDEHGDATAEIKDERGSRRPVDRNRSGERDGRAGRDRPARVGWRDRTRSVAASLRAGGWPEAAAAAGVAFVGVLCVGAALIVAAKLDLPALGTGADPIDVLTWIVILSLGSLGVPIEANRLEIVLLPMGALLAAGLIIARVTRAAHEKRGIDAAQERAVEGAKVGVPFAIICFIAALLFRHATRNEVIGAEPLRSLLLGLLWGSVFGALGALWADRRLRDIARRGLARVQARSHRVYEGIIVGGAMATTALVLAFGAVLVWAIVGLSRGAPGPRFGLGDAVASLVYLSAFLPNILIAVIALSLGAPVDAGTGLTVNGRLFRGVDSYSVTDWGGGDAPALVWFLLLVPIVSAAVGGFVARRRTADDTKMWQVVFAGAVVFAVTLWLAAAIADARLGAGLVRDRGFAAIAPHATDVLLLAVFWGILGGIVGWKASELRARSDRSR